MRQKLLDTALPLVPHLGWRSATLHRAAADLGLSPGAVASVRGGPVGLVWHFLDTSLAALKENAPVDDRAAKPAKVDGAKERGRDAAPLDAECV